MECPSVATFAAVNNTYTNNRLKLLPVNIGETSQWGYPVNDSNSDQWYLYHSCAFQTDTTYDLVLVDGRLRIACILQACLLCTTNCRILIHDFFNRPIYWIVLPFLKLEERADTMALFSIRKDEKYETLLKEYISIYEKLPGF